MLTMTVAFDPIGNDALPFLIKNPSIDYLGECLGPLHMKSFIAGDILPRSGRLIRRLDARRRTPSRSSATMVISVAMDDGDGGAEDKIH